MEATVDYPRVRRARWCAACMEPKDAGALLCWPCFRLLKRVPGAVDDVAGGRERWLARGEGVAR